MSSSLWSVLCKMASSGNHGPSTSKLRVSHSFLTKYISTLNEQLTEEHRSLIAEMVDIVFYVKNRP
ncbi:hypothetical protein LR48_Vigan432s000300 [Vigna angularis]|uniref:Uncharacterized protein n=1 Tax=Phaseolus angularis TaxID=3914 RepID=A0A0L9TAD4_PHAAN|nr:hypothetical protein LR48_Vigan432s000300 [Vigna angularis]